MGAQNPYQTYQQNSVTTATPGELTLLLYNGCLKFLMFAKKAIQDKNIEKRNENLIKAQNIINELMITLNPDVQLSENLLQIYDYLNRRLMEANTKNDFKIIEEVEDFVVELRDTWKQAIQANRQPVAQGGQV